MAATIASAAAKGNILLLMNVPRRFTTITSSSFSIVPHSNKNVTSFFNPQPKNFFGALFCTAQPTPEVVTATTATTAEEDQSKQSQPSIKDSADLLDIRVGRIVKAWRHEEADSLYVEEVDVGEAEPRVICSGLVEYVPLEYLQGLSVVVLANLKPRNMRGVKSSGMLMAASNASHTNVELLLPPQGSLPGDRIWFGDLPAPSEDDAQDQTLPEPATPNQIQKKKIWEAVQPHLKTDGDCVAMLAPHHVMRTVAGVVKSPSLKNANIS